MIPSGALWLGIWGLGLRGPMGGGLGPGGAGALGERRDVRSLSLSLAWTLGRLLRSPVFHRTLSLSGPLPKRRKKKNKKKKKKEIKRYIK